MDPLRRLPAQLTVVDLSTDWSLLVPDLEMESESALAQFHAQSMALSSRVYPLIHLLRLARITAACPLCLPRFFFQRLQTTTVRLFLLPKANQAASASTSSEAPVRFGRGIGHMVRVMGILQQTTASSSSDIGSDNSEVAADSSRVRLRRRVTAVRIELTVRPVIQPNLVNSSISDIGHMKSSRLASPLVSDGIRGASSTTLASNISSQPIGPDDDAIRLVRTVPVLRDYFQAEFCVVFSPETGPTGLELEFPSPSWDSRRLLVSTPSTLSTDLYSLRVEASLIDRHGQAWLLTAQQHQQSSESTLVRLESAPPVAPPPHSQAPPTGISSSIAAPTSTPFNPSSSSSQPGQNAAQSSSPTSVSATTSSSISTSAATIARRSWDIGHSVAGARRGGSLSTRIHTRGRKMSGFSGHH
ncbi:unnamed protein product [Protopolystoma xenopodis]|uniref:Integrator complex subunit 7 C-terminal domain-containing protein n=1 Tax=Protopolystoma xenopodis TaxID=117903 RepID=A0A3S5AVL7_9PLAT|nr:unnamed protein product [Protopolystoma xenopodis]